MDELKVICTKRHDKDELEHWTTRGSVEYYVMMWSHDIEWSFQSRR